MKFRKTLMVLALTLAVSLIFLGLSPAIGGAKKEIRVYFGGQAYFVDTMQWAAEQYMKDNPDTTVTLDLPAGDLWAKLKVLLAAGNAPDVFRMDDEIYPSFAATGTLMDLTDKIKNTFDMKDFFLSSTAVYTWKGKIYALPTWGGVVVMYYNKDLLDKAGIPYPSQKDNSYTLDKFLEDNKKLTIDRNGDGRIDQYGTGLRNWWPYWQEFIWRLGGSIYNREMTESTLNRPEAIAGMQYYADLRLKHKVAPSAAVEREEGGEGGAFEIFKAGRLAFWEDGPWPLINLREIKDLKYDLAIVPSGPNGPQTRITWDSLSIARNAKDPEAAWKFVSTIGSTEFLKRLARTGSLPSRQSIAASADFARNPSTTENEEVFLIQARPEWGRLSEITFNYPQMNEEFGRYVEEVMLGKKTVEVAFRQLKPVLDKLLVPDDRGRWSEYLSAIGR
jgi:multiple sugar transport system substrate-binding protein